MVTDISLVNGEVVITQANYKPRYFTQFKAMRNFTADGYLNLRLIADEVYTYKILLADLRIGGANTAPADEATAHEALAAVFPTANSGSGGTGEVSSLDDIPQGSNHKWITASMYNYISAQMNVNNP